MEKTTGKDLPTTIVINDYRACADAMLMRGIVQQIPGVRSLVLLLEDAFKVCCSMPGALIANLVRNPQPCFDSECTLKFCKSIAKLLQCHN